MHPFSCLPKYSPCLAALTGPSYPQARTRKLKEATPVALLQPPMLRSRQRALSFGGLGFSAPQLARWSKGSAKQSARFWKAGKVPMSEEVGGPVNRGRTPFPGVTSPGHKLLAPGLLQHARRLRRSTTRASSFALLSASWLVDSVPSSHDAAHPRASAPPSAVSREPPPSRWLLADPLALRNVAGLVATGTLPRWSPASPRLHRPALGALPKFNPAKADKGDAPALGPTQSTPSRGDTNRSDWDREGRPS
ncbi:hypothetical protein OF83DRAFT_1170430 [Amylostereum chailletii]|nr:hypothetical protein OF83DRAFT_1170430 [Amylostereum chailletii]